MGEEQITKDEGVLEIRSIHYSLLGIHSILRSTNILSAATQRKQKKKHLLVCIP